MREWPIILISVVCVAALGVGVFFWWRRRYGVWSRRIAAPRRSDAVVISNWDTPGKGSKPGAGDD